MRINQHLAQMPAGYLFSEIAKRVRAYEEAHPQKQLIRMGIGDVTLPLAPAIAQAFAQAAAGMASPEGFFGYGPEGGYGWLKDAIIANDYLPLGLNLDQDEVFISDGAKSDTAALQELLAPDALVAVSDPVYPVYVDANAMAGRLGNYQDGIWEKLVTLPCGFENGFVPPLPKEQVDVLYLCSPNNPTGTALSREDLSRIVAWARETQTLIVYDAAYKAFITGEDKPLSIYEIPGAKEVAIECCSFSKTAGFTGTRCAYTVVPKALMAHLADGSPVSLNAMWKRRLGSKFNGVSYPVQRAALATYSPEGRAQILENLAYYQENAALLRRVLVDSGLEVAGGTDAPYLWFKVPGGMGGWQFFDHLLDSIQVVGTPGEGFGRMGAGCFRLTAFSSREATKEAALRLKQALKSL